MRYGSSRAALRFLGNILTDDRGIGMLHGPEASGKSVLVEHFVQELRKSIAVAVVDGTGRSAPQLLSEILEQFGYGVELNSIDELLNMLRVIVVQQTRSHRPPVLVIENINAMCPGSLSVLCELASQMAHGRYALRIVLVGNRNFRRIINSPNMNRFAERLIGDFELRPLTAKETSIYLYAKLQSCGVTEPAQVFSANSCTQLHAASGGWPGKLDDIVLPIIDTAEHFPVQFEDVDHPILRSIPGDTGSITAESSVDRKPPKLIVTHDGKTLGEIDMTASKVMIGRSELSDLVVDSSLVSRQHALLMRDQDSVVIVDLRSRNGTFVNSRRVRSKVLQDNDIINIGHHRIKVICPGCNTSVTIKGSDIDDTATMKTIADARQAKLGVTLVDPKEAQAKD